MTITYRVRDSLNIAAVVDDLNRQSEFEEFPLTIGDTLPRLNFHLITIDEVPYDLTGCTVKFLFKRYDEYYAHNEHQECVITDAVSGMCSYDWSDDDIAVAGMHSGELELIRSDNRKLTITYPLRFNVRAKLQNP